MAKLTCAITGANGFIGSYLTRFFRAQGIRVIEMTRKKTSSDHLFFDLASTEKLPDLSNIDILIHAAYDLTVRNKKLNDQINYQGSINLFNHAKKCGVKKIIFISSMSAFDGTRSLYGKTKLAIEKNSVESGVVIVRPGLVFDENPRGIVGAMNNFIKKFKIVPLIGNGQQLFYPCHIQNLSTLLFHLATTNDNVQKPIIAASKNPLTLKKIIELLAEKQHKKIITIPIPYPIVFCGLRLMEIIGLNLGLRSDSVVGANYYDPQPNFTTRENLDLFFFHNPPLSILNSSGCDRL